LEALQQGHPAGLARFRAMFRTLYLQKRDPAQHFWHWARLVEIAPWPLPFVDLKELVTADCVRVSEPHARRILACPVSVVDGDGLPVVLVWVTATAMYPSTADKEQILSEIRRTAQQNDGKPLGARRFATETGIRQSDWSGRYWARWGDAVTEAGLEPNEFGRRSDDDDVVERLALETRRLGHLPTYAERSMRRRVDGSFPSQRVFRRLGRRRELALRVAAYCRERPDYGDVLQIVLPLVDSEEASSGDGDAAEPLAKDGFVYLLKSGRHYKLGRTNSLGRRGYELAIQLPERAESVHSIKTDDPAGIEGYWHTRFAERRKNGEWFELTKADVHAFKRRTFM
jgi:hypothetical protein